MVTLIVCNRVLCLWSHAIYQYPSIPSCPPQYHAHTHTRTHAIVASHFHHLLCSRCRDMILPPLFKNADHQACTHTHKCLQRQSCEVEVTGLWFDAITSKCSTNCYPFSVREQSGFNMRSIWSPGWSHLLFIGKREPKGSSFDISHCGTFLKVF